MTGLAARSNTNRVSNAEEMTARMEELAAAGEWSKVSQLAARVQQALLEVPESEREAAMLGARRRLARVQTKALASRNDISAKLSQIRRGQQAAQAYAESDSGRPRAGLR